MKKILLAVLLLVALIAVSYYNAQRTDSRAKEGYQQGYEKGSKESAVYQSKADSLDQALQSDRNSYADSLKRLTTAQSAVADSLTQLMASKDKQIAALSQQKKKSAKARPSTTVSKNADSSRNSISHAQILDYYRRRLQALPADLSVYERTVALNEIRTETAKKFSIQLSDLEKIRQDGNLTD